MTNGAPAVMDVNGITLLGRETSRLDSKNPLIKAEG